MITAAAVVIVCEKYSHNGRNAMTVTAQAVQAHKKVPGTFKVRIIGPIQSQEGHPNVNIELTTTFVLNVSDCGSPEAMGEFIADLRTVYLLGRFSSSPFGADKTLTRQFKTVEEFNSACDDMMTFSTWFHTA